MAITREASTTVDASPEAVYDLVADITRMGEWSPENLGGTWLDGADAPAAGARFKGRNKRRGGWSTTCTVLAAERGREFAFAVGKPAKPSAVWRYRFDPEGAGVRVTESFEIPKERPGAIERFFTKLGTGVSWDERPGDLVQGMETTLARLKAAAESRPV
jgi:uncharacterized protein YndB with AHSA1/START domain